MTSDETPPENADQGGEDIVAGGNEGAPPPPKADVPLEEFEKTDDADLSEDGDEEQTKSATDLAPVYDVPVHISAVLGKTEVNVASLMKLSKGSVLELDRKVGEAIDIYVNNRLVARGEVVIVEDRLGVTMTEIIKDGGAV